VKINATVHVKYCEYMRQHEYYVFHHDDMREQGYIPVHTAEIEFDEPPTEVLLSGTVDAFRAEQKRIQAEATARVTDIDRRINELLCIEHKAETA
jgi:hypothetical protein